MHILISAYVSFFDCSLALFDFFSIFLKSLGVSALSYGFFQTLDTEHLCGRCCFESLHMSVAPRMHLNKLPSLGDGERDLGFTREENLKDFHS